MPNLDGTGPMGLGPMTGRRRGRCVANAAVEQKEVQVESREKEIYGIGRGGRPFGGGRGNCFGGGRRGMGRRSRR